MGQYEGLPSHIQTTYKTILTANLLANIKRPKDQSKMRKDPFPPWPTHSKPILTKLEQLKETKFHTLSLQHFTLTTLNDDGTEGKVTEHDYDVVKPNPDCPAPLEEDEEWERVLSDPEDLEGLKYKRVVRVEYRHEATWVIVCRSWYI
jgi:hypothetical protein